MGIFGAADGWGGGKKAWFKFNNLGLARGTNLKFYTSVAKRSKLKVRQLGANSYVCRSYRGKTGRGGSFLPPPILNRVKVSIIPKLVYPLIGAI